MRKLLQKLLTKPVAEMADRLSSRPNKKRVDKALSSLYKSILSRPGKKGPVIQFDVNRDKFIILSDQHKGARDDMDIFALAENNYLAALDYYEEQQFFYVNLGDSEELWENLFITVKRHNKATFDSEKRFINRNAFLKIFGNHDLYWGNDPLAAVGLVQVYGQAIKIYEGAILQTQIKNKPLYIYMTHGHQGDLQSDGNWFSKWFVSDIWAPFQAYLKINLNTPANNDQLKTDHNCIMYEWSSKRENTLLLTGHTHQPVFKSLTHIEKLYDELARAKKKNNPIAITELEKQIATRHIKGDAVPDFSAYKPYYFNSGCCCFDDGDITGIEIAGGCIRLIKWEYDDQKNSTRVVLDECKLDELT
ncbi:metallophosphoesterase family protein [Mucilaginibacter sp. FT3.2]|uniref:metallophosphoesterase family protein n=1 Tax=Mucilaginibacter sp. FT3.2 TaxID=2723090 RepID=UPI001623089B|nr:metallophosphoesterase family protein [Mucilaginibacter sp. FT3.2]MBB6232639.1 tetratricopeptide (TPR) repeat protein [Mucilaginibacter sp. FT3.2]